MTTLERRPSIRIFSGLRCFSDLDAAGLLPQEVTDGYKRDDDNNGIHHVPPVLIKREWKHIHVRDLRMRERERARARACKCVCARGSVEVCARAWRGRRAMPRGGSLSLSVSLSFSLSLSLSNG